MLKLINAKELYLKLGLNKSEWSRWSKRNIELNTFFKENKNWSRFLIIPNQGGRPTYDYKITEEFMLYLINSAKTVPEKNKIDIIQKLNINNRIDIISKKEIEFLDLLEMILEPFKFKCIRQYLVCNKFRIDLYIPNLKLAIEYDENNHKDYTYKRQKGRQKEIEQKLGCKFIRVNDSETNEYNVGLVMKVIYDLKIKANEELKNNRYIKKLESIK